MDVQLFKRHKMIDNIMLEAILYHLEAKKKCSIFQPMKSYFREFSIEGAMQKIHGNYFYYYGAVILTYQGFQKFSEWVSID